MSKATLKRFFAHFPTNTTSWAKATDEMRDSAREARLMLEEYDRIVVEPLNFRSLNTPAKWNSEAQTYILVVYEMMSVSTRKKYIDYVKKTFLDTMPTKKKRTSKRKK